MPEAGSIIYGWSTGDKKAYKVEVDASGHLQVDVLSTVLPSDAATETTLALVESAVDGIEALLAGGLPAALDTDSLKVKEQGTPEVLCQGWDGAAWRNLLVEDATNFNLRVKLFDGATGIDSKLTNVALAGTERGLVVNALCCGSYNGTPYRLYMRPPNADSKSPNTYFQQVQSFLTGFDGANWDRLRTYETGILKVARAEAGLSNSGVKSADAAIKASAGKVYWMSVSDSAALNIELNDSTDGTGTDIWAAVLPANCYGHYIFDPPLEFATGIYLDVSTATCKVVVGYL